MKHKYAVTGMHCNNCRSRVEDALRKVNGVSDVMVDLSKEEAEIEMVHHVPLEKLRQGLKDAGLDYNLYLPGEKPMIHKYGGNLTMDEKGHYELTVNIDHEGKAITFPLKYIVK